MYFKRMELNGFKSFANPVTIEFAEGITCIVGPNGSGKSNIADAVRWVLGEQSPKMLRGGRMEEVIFSGTQSRLPKGMAEVTLVLDNSAKAFPSEYSEIALTRRMYRSGESDYMINGETCRLRDIRELIMDTGIAVDGYSIIGQGRIADIVGNRLDSRREIFEEAAGVTKYKLRKEETERKLSNASISLSRVNDIIKEIESRLEGLETDAKKASEYLKLKEKYTAAEVNVILKGVEQASDKENAVKEEIAELSEYISKTEKLKEKLEDAFQKEKEKAEELRKSHDKTKEELLAKSEEIHKISSQSEINKERLLFLEKEETRMESESEALEEKLSQRLSKAFDTDSEEKALKEKIEKTNKLLAEKSDAAKRAEKELSCMKKAFSDAKERVFSLTSDENRLTAELGGVENLKEALVLRRNKLKDISEEDEESLNKARIAELSVRKETLFKRNAELSEEISSEERRLSDLSKEKGDLFSKMEKLRIEESRHLTRMKLLKELESSFEGYAGGVKFILKENIKGVAGSFGDMVKVPEGLELAVETALGARLGNIICENEDAAKKAVQRLKEKRAGRLTFLPADKIRFTYKSVSSAVKKSQGYIGLASEMVSCRGGYENIIGYMLGRVIFVDTLKNALAMSHIEDGGWRFVTPEGDVINAAGAITGGRFKENSGGILVRKAEIKRLSTFLEKTAKELSLSEERLEKVRSDVLESSKRKSAAEKETGEISTKLALLKKEIENLLKEGAGIAEEKKKKNAELSDIQNEILKSDSRIEKINKGAASLKKERKAEEEKAAALFEKTEAAEKALSSLKESEAKLMLEAGSLSARLKVLEDLSKGFTSEIEELKNEKERKSKEKEDIIKSKESLKSLEEGSVRALLKKKSEKDALEKEAERLDALAKEVLDEEKNIESERSEKERKLYELRLKSADAKGRLETFSARSEALKEKLWEEFEMSYAEALAGSYPDIPFSRATKEAKECKDAMKALGDINIGAINEYEKSKERRDFLAEQREDTIKAMEELRKIISGMDIAIKKRFKENFDTVAANFESTFEALFKGGTARLGLEDPENPLESPIEIEAQPPGKKLRNMNLLSGGEKAMTAIALMFAVLKTKPAPFVILDEIEAALDEANTERFARYLKDFEGTQFALITHQRATMEHADALYGVTMPERGVTKVLSLKLGSGK